MVSVMYVAYYKAPPPKHNLDSEPFRLMVPWACPHPLRLMVALPCPIPLDRPLQSTEVCVTLLHACTQYVWHVFTYPHHHHFVNHLFSSSLSAFASASCQHHTAVSGVGIGISGSGRAAVLGRCEALCCTRS